MKSPIESFFALGDKVTKGDPGRKLDYDYYLMWVITIAFLILVIGGAWDFIRFQRFTSITWFLVGIGMLWFQYWNLKQFYIMRKMFKESKNNPQPKQELKIESTEDMLKEFQK